MGLDVKTIRESFKKIAPNGREFVTDFYERLFLDHPEVKHLFKTESMGGQAEKLLNALVYIVDNIDDNNALAPFLKKMGEVHAAAGCDEGCYSAVADALLKTFADYLGDGWNETVKQAWVDGYTEISAGMQNPA